jgi:hypothetical protein
MYDPKSISEQIESLARLTGAPEPFVCQVKSLFENKGISLDEDATPYLKALEDAFRREESIRANAERARQNVARLRSTFDKLGAAYADKLSRLDRGRETLREAGRKLGDRLARKASQSTTRVVVPEGHRSYVMRHQRDTLPLVPGPEEPQ